MYVKGDDSEMFQIKKYFQQTADFIKKAKDKVSSLEYIFEQIWLDTIFNFN